LPLIREELQRRKPPLYGPLIHDLSQALYMPFDHDDGSYARDRSGYNNHGIIYGATLVNGKIGMARFFDGVDDKVEVSHDDSIMPKELTLMAWVRWKTVTKDGFRDFVIDKSTGDVARNGYKICNWNGRIYAVIGLTSDWRGVPGPPIVANTWYHIALTFKRPKSILYVDAVEVFSDTYDDDLGSNTVDLTLAHPDWSAYWFNGDIDEVHVYNRALSAAEIARLMYLRGI